MHELTPDYLAMSAQEALRLVFARLKGGSDDSVPMVTARESPEVVLASVTRSGLAARLVEVEPSLSRFVHTPSLVALRDERWAVLVGHGRHKVQVLDRYGETHEVRRTELFEEKAAVIEISATIDPSIGLWRNVVRFASARHTTLVSIVLAMLLLQGLALVPPLLVRAALDRAVPDSAFGLLVLLTSALLTTALYRAWISYWCERVMLAFDARLEASIGVAFVRHLLVLPLSFLSRGTGELMQALNGMYTARDLVVGRLLNMILDISLVVVYTFLLVVMMPAAAIIAFASSVFIVLIGFVAAPGQARLQKQSVDAWARQRTFLLECIAGIASIKAVGAEYFAYRRSLDQLRIGITAELHRKRLDAAIDVAFDALRSSTTLAIIGLGCVQALGKQSTIGTLLASVQVGTSLMLALQSVGTAYLGFLIAKPQLARAAEAVSIEPLPSVMLSDPSRPMGVEMTGVWFRYGEKLPWILEGRDLRVAQGAHHRLEGPSGSGKSTTLRLIAGMYEPQRGEVHVGGGLPLVVRDDVLYIPQDFQLFGGSLAENLSIFSADAPLDLLLASAEETGLDEWVAKLPLRYATVFTGGGRTLSAGQRQLIAITAAAASGRRVLLLDEPMANLDRPSQLRVASSRLLKTKTIVYAAHSGTVSL